MLATTEQAMPGRQALLDGFERTGRVWLRGAIADAELERLRSLSATGNRPGARVAGDDPLFRAVAAASFTARLRSLWPGMRPVRLVSFDKTEASNWGVPWHQDRIIAVRDRVEADGYSNWSRKQGVWHCEAPESVLRDMLFVRIHLDRGTAGNGAMEIAPGSHRCGKVASDRAAAVAEEFGPEATLAEPGDVLVLKMLTLHRSLAAEASETRRVLRVDYAAAPLPVPLEWDAAPLPTG